MRIFKAIQILKDFKPNELDKFSSLFSSKQSIIADESNTFVCLSFNPDQYLRNEKTISEYFVKDYFRPLIITNYKLVALLLVTSKMEGYIFSDFSFKEDGEEAESEKEVVQEMLINNKDVSLISNFLKENSQKIQYIELELFKTKNRVRVFSNGNISLSNAFEKEYYSSVLKIVKFLFTGSITGVWKS